MFVTIGEGRNEDRLVNRDLCFLAQFSLHHNGQTPVDLSLHFPLTREQDPKVLELLHLGHVLPPDLKKAVHLLPVQNHGLRFGGVDFHPGRFTLGYEPMLTDRWCQQHHHIRKNQRPDPVPKPDPLKTLDLPRNSVQKSYEQKQ